MGNSSSRTHPSGSSSGISKPRSLAATADAAEPLANGSALGRRATTASTPRPNPSAALFNTRRTRSAQAANESHQRHQSWQAAPPSYSEVTASIPLPIPGTGPSDVSQGARPVSMHLSPGSSHTQVLSVPPTSRSYTHLPTVEEVTHASSSAWTNDLRRPMRRGSIENALDTLRKFNTVIVVDDSISMSGARWIETRNALATLADEASKYDTDGIDVCFLNSPKVGQNVKSSALIKRLFDSVRPMGCTPLGERLEELLIYYMTMLERAKARFDAGDFKALKAIKPVNYIVLTDGVPTDDPESVIVAIARRLDRQDFPLSQVGIQFVQIGDDREASAFLAKLDNDLATSYGIRDIVDTTPYTGGEISGEILIKILLGGVNRRVDKSKV